MLRFRFSLSFNLSLLLGIILSTGLFARASVSTTCSEPLVEIARVSHVETEDPLSLFRRFEQYPYHQRIHSKVLEAVRRFRELQSKTARREFLRQYGDEFLSTLQSIYGVRHIGFHFNHHGGRTEDYVRGGGLRAQRGDIQNMYTPHQLNLDQSVYLFESPQMNPADVLEEPDAKNPLLGMLFGVGRMGYVLNVFALDGPSFLEMKAVGAIESWQGAAITFKPQWLSRHRDIGVPYSSYLYSACGAFFSLQKVLSGARTDSSKRRNHHCAPLYDRDCS